jgi:hypothetical protein
LAQLRAQRAQAERDYQSKPAQRGEIGPHLRALDRSLSYRRGILTSYYYRFLRANGLPLPPKPRRTSKL